MSAPDPGPATGVTAVTPSTAKVGKASEQAIGRDAGDPRVEEVDVGEPGPSDTRYQTTKGEIWAYYAYYIGNNGLSLFNFAPTQSQNLLSQAVDPVTKTLQFLGHQRSVNSIVLLANGISFAIQAAVFLVVGSYADFGSWRPNVLIVVSLIAYGIGFGWLGVADPAKWRQGVGLYIVGLITYQTCLTFWTAAFPGLARDTKEIRDKAEQLSRGEIGSDDYHESESLMRSRLSNIAFYVQSCAELVILAIVVGIMFGLDVDKGTAQNTWGLSVLIAFASGVWLLVALPWFVLEKRRPGISPKMNVVLAGFVQLWVAVTKIWRLKQSLFYLIGYFLLGDSLNTTVTVVATLQNNAVEYSTLSLTYLLLVGIAAQAIGIYAFWYIQQRFHLSVKTMFSVIAVGIVLLDGWGMIGIWQQNFGFHNVWEFWLYQVWYGLFVCPWYSYSQIMISEVTPKGHEFLFFSLFSIIGKTSSFVGPIVSSAIIDDTGNDSSPFYFLFGLSLASFMFLLLFVDLRKSKVEQEVFLKEEATRVVLS